jgi:hypothetical protein
VHNYLPRCRFGDGLRHHFQSAQRIFLVVAILHNHYIRHVSDHVQYVQVLVYLISCNSCMSIWPMYVHKKHDSWKLGRI